jgi:hypothetical protein
MRKLFIMLISATLTVANFAYFATVPAHAAIAAVQLS